MSTRLAPGLPPSRTPSTNLRYVIVRNVPDDDRTRRRLGDETKGRIADLASGWSVEGDAPEAAPEPANAPRKKQKTLPPPPPGSAERKALEEAIVDLKTPVPIANPRTNPPNAPPRPTGSQPVIAESKVGSRSGPASIPTRSPAAVVKPSETRGAAPKNLFQMSGPTETGTVERSGVIGSKTGPIDLQDAPARSGATIAISDRSGSIVDSGPIGAKPGATPEKAGPKLPPPRSQPRTSPPPPPPPKVGSTSGSTAALKVGTASGPTAVPTSSKIGSASGPSAVPSSSKIGSASGSTAVPTSSKIGSASGSTAVPSSSKIGSASGSTATLPADQVEAKAIDRLPLRAADSTDVSTPPSAVPPPLPLSRFTRPPLVVVDEPLLETIPEDWPGSMPPLAVPVGEFDHSGTLEEDKLRIAYEQSTLKRDAASALLGISEPPRTVVKAPPVGILLEETAQHLLRGDPTSIEAPETVKFERGDPTLGQGEPTSVGALSFGGAQTGTLRDGAKFRRMRGLGGDLRYVATVLFGVRRSRRELAELEAQQATRQQARRRHLITLGRAAASIDEFDHPALGPARDLLSTAEDERSQHAGSVAAADSELTRVRREREAKARQLIEDLSAVDADLADITKKLEPLEKETSSIGRRASELRESLRRIQSQITATEASQHSVKGGKDLAGIHAEIATLKADRMAVQRDEPKIAGELDALNPRIAALEARRNEAHKRRADLEQAEQDDQRRTEELIAAIGAKRKVVDRAAGDAEAVRDRILFELGERIYVDRADDLAAQLAPIDVIDVELGTGDRRSMELREIISSVDRAKLWRGISLATVILLGVAGVATLIVYTALS